MSETVEGSYLAALWLVAYVVGWGFSAGAGL